MASIPTLVPPPKKQRISSGGPDKEDDRPDVVAREMICSSFSSRMLDGLNTLRKQDLLCDYILEAGGREISVHRCVLVACSDYFRAMFTGSMRESTSRRSQLHGVSAAGLSAIVDFAYTGKLNLTLGNLEDILSASTHLQVSEAIDLCSKFMEAATTKDNCVDMLNLTEIYTLTTCYRHIRSYILNVFDVLSETEAYYRLTSAQMASLLAENGLRVTSEYRLFELVMKWINYDLESRQGYVASLVKQLRLPLLTGEELVEKVSPTEMMRQNRECSDLLSQAKDYHIVVGKQPLLQSPRTQVRNTAQSLVMCHSESLECFNLDTAKHSFLKDAPVPLYNTCVCVVRNFLYCCGGKYDNQENNDIATARCFRYDPRFDSWYELSSMNEARKDFGLIAANDHWLYAIAGQDENMVMLTAERYSIRANEWEQIVPLRKAVYGHAVAVCRGKIYASGGQCFDGYSNGVQSLAFESDNSIWTFDAPLLSARSNHCMMEVAGKLYVLGGNVEDPYNFPIPISSVECFDPIEGSWTICKASLNIRDAGTVSLNNRVYVVGGINGQHYYSDLVQAYDPQTDQVEHVAKFPSRIYGKACCILTVPQCM